MYLHSKENVRCKFVHQKYEHEKKEDLLLLVRDIGEGNGTPLQYSCLESPMDGGAWWAAVMGSLRVRRNWATSLSLFTFMHWRRKWQPTPVFLPGESQGRGEPGGLTQSRTRLKRLSSSSSERYHRTPREWMKGARVKDEAVFFDMPCPVFNVLTSWLQFTCAASLPPASLWISLLSPHSEN